MAKEDEALKGLAIETARGLGDLTTAERFFEDVAIALKARCDALDVKVAALDSRVAKQESMRPL